MSSFAALDERLCSISKTSMSSTPSTKNDFQLLFFPSSSFSLNSSSVNVSSNSSAKKANCDFKSIVYFAWLKVKLTKDHRFSFWGNLKTKKAKGNEIANKIIKSSYTRVCVYLEQITLLVFHSKHLGAVFKPWVDSCFFKFIWLWVGTVCDWLKNSHHFFSNQK